MPERRATRSTSKKATNNNNKRKTRKAKEVDYDEEDDIIEEPNDIFGEEEEDNDEDEEEEEEEMEEERVVKRVGKKVAKRAAPIKKTPAKKAATKRRSAEDIEEPPSKKGRRNPTTYQDNDDEILEEIQEEFEEEETVRFVAMFAHLLNDPTYADVVVRLKHGQNIENNRAKGKIYAHKMILALHSKTFKAMIDSSKETLDGHTVITFDDEDITYEIVHALMEFVYTGSPKLAALSDNIQNILPVEKAIEKYLEPQFLACFQAYIMSPDNIACYYESVEYHKEKELTHKALKMIREYAPSLSFRGISLATLKSFLSDDELDIDEVQLFEKAVDWAHAIIEKERGKPIKPIIHKEDLDPKQEVDDNEEDTDIFNDENLIATRAKLLSPVLHLFRFGCIEASDFFTRVDRYRVLDEDELLDIYPLVTKAYEPKPNDPRCKERGEAPSSSWLKSRYLKLIKSWLPFKGVQLQEIYHAKNQGGLQTFWAHSRKSPLVAIFKTTTGQVFGFYTSYKWGNASRNKRVPRSDLFLFTLGSGLRKDAKKLEANNQATGIPFYDYRHGSNISLGDGYELNLQLYNGTGTSQLHYCGQGAGTYGLAGTHQFTVEDAICYTFKK